MKYISPILRTRLFTKRITVCALLALTAPLAAMAQQTVFYDTFGNSTLNGVSVPGGTPTASSTSYEIASAKTATATTNSPGHFSMITTATSSGNTEAQAIFTQYPVTLASLGDYVEFDYTFTDSTNILNDFGGNSTGLFFGLFNSGGVPPQSGTLLWNGGFSSSLTTADTGGTIGWVGYNAAMLQGQTGVTSWDVASRPVQTAADNLNQGLLYNFPQGGKTYNLSPGTSPFPNLVIGTQYTAQLRITLSAAGTLTVSNAMYVGAAVGGTFVFSNTADFTSPNFLTTNFDSLAIGYRAGDSLGTHIPWTNDINSITVIAGLAAQAGPYYSVTTSGTGCDGGGITVGLNGSVTTNAYLLYLNGADSGQSVLGTGSAISFGSETTPGTYTVVASNTITASEGPMYGSAFVSAGAPVITMEPASVTRVTNVTASFTVVSTGNALSYQWYQNGIALTNGGNIFGAQTTNLVIAPTLAANAASVASGYYVVIKDQCGDVVPSTPNASLTLIPPAVLSWQGGNPDNSWDYSELNFIDPSEVATAFSDGDDVIFNDTSGNNSVTISNNVVPTLVTVNSANGYTFSGPGEITGFGTLEDIGSGALVIGNANNYTGGTIVSNGATLTIGTGSGTAGSLGGLVSIAATGVNSYNYAGPGNATPVNILNTWAGSGTVNCSDANGSILATTLTGISSNFTGTINVEGYTSLHASDGNAGYNLGNGSTINVPDNAQVWLDRSATVYNNTFNIGGTGWQGSSPNTGALRVYANTLTGPINFTDNARIGGTINGATILGQINGGTYQLEVYGVGYGLGSGSSEFVLSVGTNTATNVWGSALITSGALRALAPGAISTNSMTIDVAGELDTFGNTVAVNNLNDGPSGSGAVYNMNTTNAGTLVVGGDGSSTEFDGTFGNGSSQPLNLTKVGAGTLTLTAVNTNTGTVAVSGGTLALSGSGSFAKASVIAPAGGGIYDVTAAGGTLTLASGQTLEGNGTVNGTLSAPAGSIVWPGLPMGALTISSSGASTANGTYRSNLNRTNANNCSTLTASGGGSVTFSAATLSVTNIGPALQANDTFQLFPGANTGFSTFNLESYDYVNKVNYSWNNTVATDGKISVATVTSRVLALQTAPSVSAITYGQAVSNSIVSGGAVTNASGVAVPGAYAFVTPGTRPFAGTTNQSVTFTPTDSTDYNAFTFIVSVAVNPQTPLLKTAPTASAITNGSPLSASILTGGAVTNAAGTNVVGIFTWTTPSATPAVGTDAESVTFSPTDSTDYSAFTFNVNVTVVAGPSAVTALKFIGSPAVSGNSLTFSATNAGAGTFYLLTGTNVASPLSNWTPVWTNVAAGSSSFTTNVINAVNQALGKQFYILSTTNE